MALNNMASTAAARSSTSLANARERIAHLSDPPERKVDAHLFDYLCMEVRPAAAVCSAPQR
jgi:hypothetical protein